MKKVKVSEATNSQLNWLVAKCEGKIAFERNGAVRCRSDSGVVDYWFAPTTTWSEMGPIIERENIELECREEWRALMRFQKRPAYEDGPTPLIAAARCYVTSKLGETVEVPEELDQ